VEQGKGFFHSEDPEAFTGEHIEAEIRMLEERVSRSETDAALLFRLATLYLGRQRTADAIKMLEATLQAEPHHVEAYFLLGNCYIHFDQFEFAARYYIKAVKLSPEHLPALFNLGFCYEKLGMAQKAIAAFKKFYVLSKDPHQQEEARFRLFKLGLNIE